MIDRRKLPVKGVDENLDLAQIVTGRFTSVQVVSALILQLRLA